MKRRFSLLKLQARKAKSKSIENQSPRRGSRSAWQGRQRAQPIDLTGLVGRVLR
jgi:hypothetical protein